MVAFPAKVPVFIQQLLRKKYLWKKVPTKGKVLYLTFDDGPIPELTPWVLSLLKQERIKATFFCVGENAEKNSSLLEQIIQEGHKVGNHTYNHLNGWLTKSSDYLNNFHKASKLIDSTLFRPPYGKITRSQASVISQKSKIVMWSVLTKDYDTRVSPKQCLNNALMCKSGDIVVFHDNIKATRNLQYALPKFIHHYKSLGYKFATL